MSGHIFILSDKAICLASAVDSCVGAIRLSKIRVEAIEQASMCGIICEINVGCLWARELASSSTIVTIKSIGAVNHTHPRISFTVKGRI